MKNIDKKSLENTFGLFETDDIKNPVNIIILKFKVKIKSANILNSFLQLI